MPRQFHDGLGFLTNHALLSNTFEYSLQQVNPKLTLPYWDFTIESSTAGGSEGENILESQMKTPVLQESWFGTVDPEDNMVRGALLLPKVKGGARRSHWYPLVRQCDRVIVCRRWN